MRKINLLIIIYIIGYPLICHTQGTTSAEFLKIPVGVRQAAMGGAFTGVGDDVYTVFWNPGGLGLIRNWELAGSINKWFTDTYYASFLFAKQYRCLGSRKTTFGIGAFYLGMSDWDNTEGLEPSVTANDFAGIISLGQRLDWLSRICKPLSFLSDKTSLGMNVKYIHSKLAQYDTYALAVDMGVLFRTNRFRIPFFEIGPFENGMFSTGFTVQNLGTKMKFYHQSSPLPVTLRGGIGFRLLSKDKLHHLLLAADISRSEGTKHKFHLGAEYWYRDCIGLRFGYKMLDRGLDRRVSCIDRSDLTFGVSVKLCDVILSKVHLSHRYMHQIDMAGSDYGEVLGFTYRGSFASYSMRPEPFRLLVPADLDSIKHGSKVIFKWENTIDPDPWGEVSYCLIIGDSIKIQEAVDSEGKGQFHSWLSKNKDLIEAWNTNKTEDSLTSKKLDEPGYHCWAVIAYDTDTLTYMADGSRKFRTCIRLYPDLSAKLDVPETNIFIGDSTRLNIKIINIGKGAVTNKFRISVFDTYHSRDGSPVTESIMDTLIEPPEKIERLSVFPKISRSIWWKPNQIGRHEIVVIADSAGNIKERELNKTNNKASEFITVKDTIPLPFEIFVKDTLNVKKKVYDSIEIPIVPMVFFDTGSSTVNPEYYNRDTFYQAYIPELPEEYYDNDEIKEFRPVLEVLAKRLNEKDDKEAVNNLFIKGFIDKNSGEKDEKLAYLRAETVKKILMDEFGVNGSQIIIDHYYDPTIRRIFRSSRYTTEREWINHENRRVEFHVVPTIHFNAHSAKVDINYYKYRTEQQGYNTDSQNTDQAIPILEHVADGLRENPESIVFLKGFIDTLSDERNRTLAFSRAEAVRRILIDYYKCDSSRIVIQKCHDPERRRIIDESISREEQKQINHENRRVEVHYTEDKEKYMFGSIRVYFIKDFIGEEDYVIFTMKDNNKEFDLKSWRLEIMDSNNNKVKCLESSNKKISWDCTDEKGELVDFNKIYYHKSTVTDINNQEHNSERYSFYLKQDRIVIKEEIYSLAIFEKTMPTYNFYWRKLPSIAKSLCVNDSLEVIVVGHCDSICYQMNPCFAAELSKNRAEVIKEALKDTLKNILDTIFYIEKVKSTIFNRILDIPIFYVEKDRSAVLNRILDSPTDRYGDFLAKDCNDPNYPLINGRSYYEPLRFKISINNKQITLRLGNNKRPLGRNWNRRVMIKIERRIEE